MILYGFGETADMPIILGIANDGFWRVFCEVADKRALAEDSRFKTNGDRVANREILIPIVAAILACRNRSQWLVALAARGIPSSPVHTLGELSEHPQTKMSGMVLREGSFQTVASPLRADGERLPLVMRPPALGEHSRAVLSEIGYENDAIDALIADGVVAARNASNTRR